MEQRQTLTPREVKQQQRYCVLIVSETQQLKKKEKTMISSLWRFCKCGYAHTRTHTDAHRLMSSQGGSVSYWMSVGNWPIKVPLTSSHPSPHIDMRGISVLLVSLNLLQSSPPAHSPLHIEPACLNRKHFWHSVTVTWDAENYLLKFACINLNMLFDKLTVTCVEERQSASWTNVTIDLKLWLMILYVHWMITYTLPIVCVCLHACTRVNAYITLLLPHSQF